MVLSIQLGRSQSSYGMALDTVDEYYVCCFLHITQTPALLVFVVLVPLELI